MDSVQRQRDKRRNIYIFAAISCCYFCISCALASYEMLEMLGCFFWVRTLVVLNAVAFLMAFGTGLAAFCGVLRTFSSAGNAGIPLPSASLRGVIERRKRTRRALGHSVGMIIAIAFCRAFGSISRCVESLFDFIWSTTLLRIQQGRNGGVSD